MTTTPRVGSRRRVPALAVGALALALALAACGSTAATPAASPLPTAGPIVLDGTSWLLIGYATPDGTTFTVPGAVTPQAAFAGGQFTGHGGCNTINGPYTQDGEVISIGPLASTKVACDEPLDAVEAAYVEALGLANRAAMLDNGRLQLWDTRSKSTLQFIPAG